MNIYEMRLDEHPELAMADHQLADVVALVLPMCAPTAHESRVLADVLVEIGRRLESRKACRNYLATLDGGRLCTLLCGHGDDHQCSGEGDDATTTYAWSA